MTWPLLPSDKDTFELNGVTYQYDAGIGVWNKLAATAGQATIGAYTVNHLVVTEYASLGNISNVKISGGTEGYFIATHGNGDLFWQAVSSGQSIMGGNSNVLVNANSNVTVSVAGVANTVIFTSTGANIAGTLRVTGNTNVGNLGGSTGAFTGNVSTGNLVTGSITSGNITAGNSVTANYFVGMLSTGTQTNITRVGTLVSLAVTGNIDSGNVNGGNLVKANYIQGNGSALSSLVGGNVVGQVANANIADQVYTNAQPNITSVGRLANLTVGNSTANTVLGNGTITAAGNISAANLIGPLANGNSNISITQNGNVAITTSSNTTLVITGTGINVAGTLNATGNANVGNLGTTGNVTATNITATSVSATTLTGTLATASNAQPNITSVGTLTSVAVTGNATVGNLSTAGNVTANNITATSVSATTLTGTFTTSSNAQPNITSVGTLTSLAVTGNITSGNANLGNLLIANYHQGTLTTAAQPNITSVGTLVSLAVTGNITSGNANLGNLVTSNYFSGSGNLLSNIQGGNVTGQVGNALIAGTVYTAAQPNITSVGTLTSLAVTGNISSGNIAVTGAANAANITVANLTANTSINFANAWATGSQSTETLSNLGAVASSTIACNLSTGATFYHSSVTLGANWTVNLTNVPTTTERSIIVTIMVVQGTTPYVPTTLQIDGTSQSLKWINGVVPSGRASAVDIFSFALIRTGSAWAQILGSYTTYL